MLHAIVSRSQKRRAEIAVTQEGLQLFLRSEGEPLPFSQGSWMRCFVILRENRGSWILRGFQCASDGRDGFASDQRFIRSVARYVESDFDENDLLRMHVSWENRSDNFISEAAVGILFSLPKRSKEKGDDPAPDLQ